MAKRRVYSVDNLYKCAEYLEDSDDSVKDATWNPSPKKTKRQESKTRKTKKYVEKDMEITKAKTPKCYHRKGYNIKSLTQAPQVLSSTSPPVARSPLSPDPPPIQCEKAPILPSTSPPVAHSPPDSPSVAAIAYETPPGLPDAHPSSSSDPKPIECETSPILPSTSSTVAHLPPDVPSVTPIAYETPPVLPSTFPPDVHPPSSSDPKPIECETSPILQSTSPPVAHLPPDSPSVAAIEYETPPVLASISPPDTRSPSPLDFTPTECESPSILPSSSPSAAHLPPDVPSMTPIACDVRPVLPSNSLTVDHSPVNSPPVAPIPCKISLVLPSNFPPVAHSAPNLPPVAPLSCQTSPVLPSTSAPAAQSSSNASPVTHSLSVSPSIIQPQSDEEMQTKDSRQSRKKKKDITTWKKNIRKRRRNEGKEYISTKGKTVQAKTLETYNHVCRYQCDTFTEDKRQQIHSEFWKLGNWEAQTNFIRYCVRIEKPKRSINKKKKSTVITLSDKRVCKDFFLKTLTISNRRFTNAAFAKTAIDGLPVFDKRGKHEPGNKTKEDKLKEVREHINSFPKFKSHYSLEDAPLKRYLSPELTVSKMYSLYKEKIVEEGGERPVKEHIYRKVFNNDFNLGFYKLRSDTCNTCDRLENLYKSETNAEIKQNIKQEKENHLLEVERTRLSKKNDSEDNIIHMITFDLEKTLPTPYLQTNLVYYKRQLWTYNLGIHDCKTGDAHMYMWSENIASRGASEVASCLLKYINSIVPEDCEHLVAYSDSCGGQNRNQIICRLWMYIVTHTSIATVDHKFMVSGHSYLENDRDFSHIEKMKKKAPYIFVPEDWMTLVEKTRKSFTVHRMQQKDFVSTDPISKVIVNRKIESAKNKVNWLKIRWMRFLKEQPKSMFYKESLDVNTPFRHVNMDSKKGNIPKVLPQLRETEIKMKPAKIKDLKELLKFIPSIHHEFYNSLTWDENQPSTSTNRSRGRPRKESVKETDEDSILDYTLDQ